MDRQFIPQSFLFRIIHRLFVGNKQKKSLPATKKRSLDKRQKFALSTAVLAIGLFVSAYSFNAYGVGFAALLATGTSAALWWGIRDDLKETFSSQVFILPFLLSLAFGLFSYLAPPRLITRIIITLLYMVGLYSTFLIQNIFIVASTRTIALLQSARIISQIVTLVTFAFLVNTIFSLRLPAIPTVLLIALCTYLLTLHALWTYLLSPRIRDYLGWASVMTLCIAQCGIVAWFWPAGATVVTLFLTGMLYIFIGVSHAWIEKRLFRNVLWEYAWVGLISLLVLIAFTQWR